MPVTAQRLNGSPVVFLAFALRGTAKPGCNERECRVKISIKKEEEEFYRPRRTCNVSRDA
jgi:hypothetical protein